MVVFSQNGGFGVVSFGRSVFGQAFSEHEPRFYESDPVDGAIGVSLYEQTIKFSIYCFSSRVMYGAGSGLLIEISEDGGLSYADAYASGAFVSPYNGSNSKVDANQSSPEEFVMYIHKTSQWIDEKQVIIRVTAQDEYESESTKETPVVW